MRSPRRCRHRRCRFADIEHCGYGDWPQALGLEITCAAGCDLKPAAQRFVFNNWSRRVAHYFHRLEDLVDGCGRCVVHDRFASCRPPCGLVIDCLVTGTPCQAWSRNRDKRSLPPAKHSAWHVTFGTLMDLLDCHHIKIMGGISEQVVGFAEQDRLSGVDHLEGHKSPWELFCSKLRSRGFHVTTLRLNSNAWLSFPPRDRLYIVWVSDALGGADALRAIEKVVQETVAAAAILQNSGCFWEHDKYVTNCVFQVSHSVAP